MEWYIMNSTGVRSLATGFGSLSSDGKNYHLSDECSESLSNLIDMILSDDVTTYLNRRHILAEGLVEKDFSKLISHGAPDVEELGLTIRLLSLLCEQLDFTCTSNEMVKQDCQKLSRSVLSLFMNMEFVGGLFTHLKELVDEAGEDELSSEGYQCLQHSLNLINHVVRRTSCNITLRTAVIGLLLHKDLSALLLYCICCHKSNMMTLPIVQILSTLYHKFQWNEHFEAIHTETDQGLVYVHDKLKYLIVRMLQGPISNLIKSLSKMMLYENKSENYLAWAIAFFLPFLKQIHVPIDTIRPLFRGKVLGYLVYQASALMVTEFDSNKQMTTSDDNFSHSAQLVFSAIESLLNLLSIYECGSLEESEQTILIKYYSEIYKMHDLWNIVLMYIRRFELTTHTRLFLSQLILINHKLLTAVQYYMNIGNQENDNVMLNHVQQFANNAVISKLAIAAEKYRYNTAEVNQALFTLFSHIITDCHKVTLMYQPALLRILGEICDNSIANTQDRELAEYVMSSFVHNLDNKPEVCIMAMMDGNNYRRLALSDDNSSSSDSTDWSSDEEAELLTLYATADNTRQSDMVRQISKGLKMRGKYKQQKSVEKKLIKMGYCEDMRTKKEATASEIKALISEIARDKPHIIKWLKESLALNSFVKSLHAERKNVYSPISVVHHKLQLDSPILPFNTDQELSLSDDTRVQLLLRVLRLNQSSTCIPYIPHCWTAGEVYRVAELLGTLENVTFSEESESSISNDDEMMKTDDQEVFHRPVMPSPNSSNNSLWMMYMKRTQFDPTNAE